MEDRIEELNKQEEILNITSLIDDINEEIESEKAINIDKGNKLLRLNLLMGVVIGLIAYFLLDVTHRYLIALCVIAIILIILIFLRVKYVVDNLEKFRDIVVTDLKKQIDELKRELE